MKGRGTSGDETSARGGGAARLVFGGRPRRAGTLNCLDVCVTGDAGEDGEDGVDRSLTGVSCSVSYRIIEGGAAEVEDWLLCVEVVDKP